MKLFFTHKINSRVIVVIVLLLLWFLVSQTKWVDTAPTNLWFAKPSEVCRAVWEIISSHFYNVFATFARVIVSVLITLISAIIGGLIIGFYSSIYSSLKPTIDFWRSIPPIVVIPILLYWDTSHQKEIWRIMLVFFGCFPILTMLIAEAINNASQNRLSIFQALNTGIGFKMKNVVIYEILPTLFTGTRTILSIAIIIVIVSEMVCGTTYGIGVKIVHYQNAYEIQFVYAYAIILGLIGFLLNNSIRKLEKRIIKWN
jgi:NitT/TauT family transport system permease protein